MLDVTECAGCLDLIYTGLAGKLEGLQMMTKVETGSHMGMSLVQCKKVCALVLEPISTGFHPSPCFGLVVCASSFHHCAIFWWTYFVVFAGCALLTA